MSSRPPTENPILQDLVERRIEAPEVEYKNWMPLIDTTERANVARHICALANYGGGHLIFGFNDDGTPAADAPTTLNAYDQDAINGICERYLVPVPHCETHIITASTGVRYPVIRVPAHSEQPICAKRDGPTHKGRPAGIVAGNHYIRIAGPQSVPINSPNLWQSVIRRCVFAERTSLLSSIGQLFDRPDLNVDTLQTNTMGSFLTAIIADWDSLTCPAWPGLFPAHRITFGFCILNEDGNPVQPLTLNILKEAIRAASFASSDDVNDGSASFEQRWQLGKQPRVALVGQDEAYEALILPDEKDQFTLPTLWRVAATGVGGDVTAFSEDNDWVRGAVEERSSRRWPPSERFAPWFQAQHVAQHIAFVGRLAEAYPDAAFSEILVDYVGLQGRTIGDPRPGIYFSLDRTSTVDHRRVQIRARTATLVPDCCGH